MTAITSISPGTFSATGTYRVDYQGPSGVGSYARSRTGIACTFHDDSSGGIWLTQDNGAAVLIGSLNYSNGDFTLSSLVSAAAPDPYGPVINLSGGGGPVRWDQISGSNSYRYVTISTFNDPRVITPVVVVPVTVPEQTVSSLLNTVASVTPTTLLVKAFTVSTFNLKGVSFDIGADHYAQTTDGTLYKNQSPTTGIGTPAGNVSGASGIVGIVAWTGGTVADITNWRGIIAPPSVGVEAPFTAFSATFRTASSPLRTGSVSILGTMQDGTTFNVTAGNDGKINGTRVKGKVDYQYGLVELYFVNPAGDVADNIDLSFLQIGGLTSTPRDLVKTGSVRYNAVAFSYLPLDATLLGIDPVRLPSDGKVPIFRAGGFAVVGHTGKITATVSNLQVVNCARVRLSRVRVVGFNGVVINTGYTTNLDAGTVTFLDVTGYSQPVTVEHRIEDMAVVREAQISGEVTFTRALTHDYPLTVPPTSFVSSALVAGDLYARVSVLFDQATWNGITWLDSVSGAAATGTFNDVLAPIVVTNMGAVTERWALVFTNTTSFNIVGEHVGVIGTGSINTDLAPLNPATGVAYFSLAALGWGIGWSVGNIVRFNTVGAMTPVWVVRTVQQGPNTGTEHSFTLLSRGDVNRV